MTPQEYQNYVRRKQKKSPLGKDMALAFLIGGLICAAGQGILNGWLAAGLREEDAAAATSISLVFLSALLTALNLYNKLARFGGAGTLVPITALQTPSSPPPSTSAPRESSPARRRRCSSSPGPSSSSAPPPARCMD